MFVCNPQADVTCSEMIGKVNSANIIIYFARAYFHVCLKLIIYYDAQNASAKKTKYYVIKYKAKEIFL